MTMSMETIRGLLDDEIERAIERLHERWSLIATSAL
jgi:hypothetical protein